MVSGSGKPFYYVLYRVIAHLLLKELLFFKLPSSKEFHTCLWIFQYLCGYYLFGMTTASEKFSDTQ